jgi:hypothetical protein
VTKIAPTASISVPLALRGYVRSGLTVEEARARWIEAIGQAKREGSYKACVECGKRRWMAPVRLKALGNRDYRCASCYKNAARVTCRCEKCGGSRSKKSGGLCAVCARSPKLVTWLGKEFTLAELSHLAGVGRHAVCTRIQNGLDPVTGRDVNGKKPKGGRPKALK